MNDIEHVPPSGAGTAAGRRHSEHGRFPAWAAVLVAVLCGAAVALQSRINGELAREIDDPYAAALISFGSGLLVLLVLLACWRPGRAGLARLRSEVRGRRIARWMLLGGLAGGYFVTTQGLSAGILGVAVFTVAIVAGQTVGGLVFDVIGLGPGGRRRITGLRAFGAALALAAIGWAVSGQLAHDVPVLLLLLPFLAGIGAAWQQAVNGRVRSAAGSAFTATLVNFAVGTSGLVVVVLVHAVTAGFPTRFPAEPWLYLGGVVGCLFIAGQAAVVRVIGVLVLALAGVAGQLAAALALDLLVPAHGSGVEVATIGGAVLALVAVVLASLPGSRRRPASDGADRSEPSGGSAQ